MSFYDDEEDDGMHELLFDSSLPAVERIAKYSDSELILHRVHLLKDVGELCEELGFAGTCEHVVPFLERSIEDAESVVRQALAEELVAVCYRLLTDNLDAAVEMIASKVLPLVLRLVIDDNVQVRCVAAETMQHVCTLLDWQNEHADPHGLEMATATIQRALAQQERGPLPPTSPAGADVFGEHIQPILMQWACAAAHEEHRVIAAELLHKIALVFPSYVTDEILKMLVSLSFDRQFRVRKAVALALGPCCARLGADVVHEHALPTYLELCRDDIWGVRKACAESLVGLSRAVSAEKRATRLVAVFDAFVSDLSRWVRTAAFQNLGPFIATFEGGEVPTPLFTFFVSMKNGMDVSSAGSDTVLHCAYSFPGVLLTVGPRQWPDLRELYAQLTQDLQWKVRQTLSHSLHEVAKIIGTQSTECDLLPTFELFLKDLDQVKLGVVRHLAKFLAVLSQETRESYIGTIEEIQSESVNWRFRKLLAKQLHDMAALYSVEIVRDSIVPIALQLCLDQVARVRTAAESDVGPLLEHLAERDHDVMMHLARGLCDIATHESCISRQTFARMCERIISCVSAELFKSEFFPLLERLGDDPAPNVRFIVARVVAQQINEKEQFADVQQRVNVLLEKLRADADREVRFYSYFPLRDPSEFERNPQVLDTNADAQGAASRDE